MWRMLQRLFGRQPRRTVVSRLRLQVEALENRLVPSASPLGSLLPIKEPAIGYASAHSKVESKVADSPQVHKSEDHIVAFKKRESAEANKGEKQIDALKKSSIAEAGNGEKYVVALKESGMPGIPVEPDRPVHGYKWRPRPWEVGADTKYEVMRADFDFKL